MDIFLIFAQNIDCGNTLEPLYTACLYIKVGFKGVYITRTCFCDVRDRHNNDVFVKVLRFNVQGNNFQSSWDGVIAPWILNSTLQSPAMCLAQCYNTVTTVGIEPKTARFGIRRSANRHPRSS